MFGFGDRNANGNRCGLLSAARLLHGNSTSMKKDHRGRAWESSNAAAHTEMIKYSPTECGCLLDVSVTHLLTHTHTYTYTPTYT